MKFLKYLFTEHLWNTVSNLINPENATEHAKTRDESAIENAKGPYDQGDIILITEGDGESPRKKKTWDSKEEKYGAQWRNH